MAIKTEYRLHFESEQKTEDPTSLEVSANGEEDDLAVFLAIPDRQGDIDLILQLNREEALELKAILSVLTGTASHEDEVTVGVLS